MLHVPADYEIVIKPTKGWFKLNLADVWRYRDLVTLLVNRDFVSKYKQTVLGPLWFIIQPLLTTVVFTIIFGKVAQIPTDGVPPMLFYLCGLLGWNYFAQTFQATAGTLTANAGMFGKVYFPRLVVPLATVISGLISFAIQLATFLVFWLYFKCFTEAGNTLHMGWDLLWFPLVMLQVSLLSLGVGLWLTSLTAKYRDFIFIIGFLAQIWMYATPVIYPLSRIPDSWRWVAVINPMTMPVEAIKRMFLGQGIVEPAYVAVSSVMALVLLLSGVVVFNKVEKTFVDTV
ncbi:MAG: ABC transporter permease, partial [Chthoniobacterales bacterium]